MKNFDFDGAGTDYGSGWTDNIVPEVLSLEFEPGESDESKKQKLVSRLMAILFFIGEVKRHGLISEDPVDILRECYEEISQSWGTIGKNYFSPGQRISGDALVKILASFTQ